MDDDYNSETELREFIDDDDKELDWLYEHTPFRILENFIIRITEPNQKILSLAGILFSESQRETALGCLEERFYNNRAKLGATKAHLYLLRDVIESVYPTLKEAFFNRPKIYPTRGVSASTIIVFATVITLISSKYLFKQEAGLIGFIKYLTFISGLFLFVALVISAISRRWNLTPK